MRQKEKNLLFGHIILLLLELIVVLSAFSEDGFTTLRYYTTDSNLLCGIASLLYLLWKLPALNREGNGVVSRYFQNKDGAFCGPERNQSLTFYFYGVPHGDLCGGPPCFGTGTGVCP